MSYFYICPTERVLDTAEAPNPGAVRPDRAQRAGRERQSGSVVTDGSRQPTIHKYMEGEAELNQRYRDTEGKDKTSPNWSLTG